MRIDAHHHLWVYSKCEYPWIDDTMAAIRRDFLPEDLAREAAGAGISRVISVQARQTLEETRWLLSLAQASPLIAGVVGWVPLRDPAISDLLQELARAPQLKGVRHVLQEETEPGFMLAPEFNRGLEAVTRLELTYDILIREHQLSEAIQLVDRHPNQRFVVDHIAKPKIADGEMEPWRSRLGELARRPNVWCKLSGVVTEAAPGNWSETSLRPWMEAALEAFGPRRLMFGSDWPVCLVETAYTDWVRMAERLTSGLSPDEQQAFWQGNATEAYRLA